MIRKSLLLLLFILLVFIAAAQEKPLFYLSNSTYISQKNNMPFWIWANRYGTLEMENRFLNLSEFGFALSQKNSNPERVSWSLGTTLVGGLAKKGNAQLNEAYVLTGYRGWQLRAGMLREELKYGGLSATNGNLARSTNARPYPLIRFSTADFIPLPILKKYLSFKAEYDEGLLNDKRFVHNTHLHHKSLYLSIKPNKLWDFRVGFEHFVMWGGESQDDRYGKLPSDLDAYWRYVFAATGNESFPLTDQINVAGNQFGTYQAEIIRNFSGGKVTFYLSHPYEDYSGIVWRNWPDNLMGAFIQFTNSPRWLSGILYEFTNTRQQSVKDSLYTYNQAAGKWIRQENDNYFSHGVYRTGYTYHRKMMGSPLFFPVTLDKEGVPINGGGALESSRFIAHHAGLTGVFARYFPWKMLATYVMHYGTYGKEYLPPRKQVSGLLELQFVGPEFPVELGVSFAADKWNIGDNQMAIGLTMTKRW